MGITAKQVIDFRPSKGVARETSNEIQRKRSEKAAQYAHQVGNYDPTRVHLNFEIVKGGKIQPVDKSRSIPRRMKEMLKERGIADPNEGLEEPKYRTVVNFILGGSRERMHEIAFGSQKVDLTEHSDNSNIRLTDDFQKWSKEMYQFMAERYGEENIVSFVAHLDELNPHLHVTILPIDKNNRFAYKKIFAGKDKYEFRARTTQLHDDLAKVNEKWRLGRGSSIAATGARHRTTEEYRRQLNEECISLEGKVDNDRKTLLKLRGDIMLAERSVKGLTSMIHNLEEKKKTVQSELDSCYRQVSSGQVRPEDMDKQVLQLLQKLQEIESQMADKNQKLSDADQRLERLRSDMDAAKQRMEELRSQAQEAAGTVYQHQRAGVTDATYNVLMEEFKHIVATSDDAVIDSFDDSMLMDFARRGNNIMQCAVMLVAGYVDQATEFAEGHGGGGGGNDMRWGRDPDEDDRRWARRCVRMACQMMKPAIGKKNKR